MKSATGKTAVYEVQNVPVYLVSNDYSFPEINFQARL
jgi:hypothetical protein